MTALLLLALTVALVIMVAGLLAWLTHILVSKFSPEFAGFAAILVFLGVIVLAITSGVKL